VYVVAPPDVDSGVEFVRAWRSPRTAIGKVEDGVDVSLPDVSDVVNYLEAFYHGFPVKLLPPSGLKFTA
jgi:archaemetzincin